MPLSSSNKLSPKHIFLKIIRSNRYRTIARMSLGILFIYASLDKIAFPREFSEIVISYHVLPTAMAISFALVLPWLEVISGTLLVLGIFIRKISVLICILLSLFIIALAFRSIKGEIGNCGCFSVNSASPANYYLLIVKDVLLLLLGISLFWQRTLAPGKE